MIFNERAVPPAFIVDAIPGAPELREAVATAREAIREAASAMRAAVEQMREKAVGPLGDMTPREGVTKAAMDTAIDAYRHATEASRAAQDAHSAALRRLHAKVRAGMQTDAFKASHEQLADDAQAHAVAAGAALWKALEDRNNFDAAIGRWRDPSAAAPFDLRYYRDRIESILNAAILTDHQRLVDRLESSTMTAEEHIAFAKRNGMIAG